MRIFQVIEDTTNASLPANTTWRRCLYESLVELGHDVHLVSASKGRLARQRNDARLRAEFSDELTRAFETEHRKRPFDIFFSYLTDGMVDPAAIDMIRQFGVPTFNFSCNNVHQFDLVRNLSRHFDYSLHAEKAVRQKFIDAGANPHWWPMASNPKYFRPHLAERTVPVSFVGANYAVRARYISHLLDHEIDVQVFGPTWRHGARTPLRAAFRRMLLMGQAATAIGLPAAATASARLAEHDFNRRLSATHFPNLHEPISDEGAIQLYSRSRISLGVLEVHEANDPSRQVLRHLHLRDFEAPMCGACYCTGHLDELAEFFEPGVEIVTYRHEDELLDKVRFYLAHPADAERIRQAGHRRALAEHTYQVRYQKLFAEVGLPA